jgi:glycosyltransferase involved in cell wall biosynthesis
MRILVASTIVPFVEGGATVIVSDVVNALRRAGHDVDTVLVPFAAEQASMTEQMLALRLFDVAGCADLLVALRTPSYLLEHPNKVVWFLHHHRPAYDLWETAYRDLPPDEHGIAQRLHLVEADTRALQEARQLFANSTVTADRLSRFNGLEAEVLYPPLGDDGGFRCEEFSDVVLCPGRVAHIKRQALLVQSMAHVRSGVRLLVVGPPDSAQDADEVERAIVRHRVADRVEFRPQWVSEEEKRELLASALACAYAPLDEDSYGYVTLEAFHSRKPVVTCRDSGGTLELVEDDVTGLVAEPTPEAIAEAFDRLWAERGRARAMGEAGFERVHAANITWEHVVDRLTA